MRDPQSLKILQQIFGTTLIYVLCGLISQSLLPVTEVYENTSAPWRRGILSMSRGTKSKAAS
ncbi:unnamed protein product, partial [Ascophyllum nodosum]